MQPGWNQPPAGGQYGATPNAQQGYPGVSDPQQAYAQPAAAGYSAPQAPPKAAGGTGFVASLFDFSFTSFVTTKVVKVLYGLYMLMGLLGILAFDYEQLQRAQRMSEYGGSSSEAYLTILVSPLMYCVMVLLVRIMLEVTVVMFRIAEQLSELNRKTREP